MYNYEVILQFCKVWWGILWWICIASLWVFCHRMLEKTSSRSNGMISSNQCFFCNRINVRYISIYLKNITCNVVTLLKYLFYIAVLTPHPTLYIICPRRRYSYMILKVPWGFSFARCNCYQCRQAIIYRCSANSRIVIDHITHRGGGFFT